MKPRKNESLKFLMYMWGMEKGVIAATVIATIIATICGLTEPLIVRDIANIAIYKDQPMDAVWKDIALLIGVMLMTFVTQWFRSVEASSASDRVMKKIRIRLYSHLNKLGHSYFDENKSGEISSIVTEDVGAIDTIIWGVFSEYVAIIVSVIGGIVVLYQVNIQLLLVSIPIILFSSSFIFFYKKYMRKTSKAMKDKAREEFAFIEDKLAGIRTVLSFGNTKRETERISVMENDFIKIKRNKWKCLYGYHVSNNFFYYTVDIISLAVGAFLAINDKIKVTDVIIFYSSVNMILNPMMNFSNMVKELSQSLVSCDKILDVLNTEPEVKEVENPYVPDKMNGKIEFENVSFKYRSSENMVLKNFTLSINPGEYVALVGPSGAGKSTIASLVPRYYDTCSGCITIDNINIKDYEIDSLRKNIGVVQQDVYLFLCTIYENIAYGVENATMKDVVKAAKLAYADEFIKKLPQGYNTDIGEKGVKLSGGQRQRIAIARLFLLNPSVLIFDEATSALDKMSEKLIQKAMDNIAKNRTVITIAHNLSTIKNADRIVYVSEEGIQEEGSHSQLMAFNGKYAKLYNMTK